MGEESLYPVHCDVQNESRQATGKVILSALTLSCSLGRRPGGPGHVLLLHLVDERAHLDHVPNLVQTVLGYLVGREPLRSVPFVLHELQPRRSLREQVHGPLQLVAAREDVPAAHDVQAEPRPGHRDDEAADVPQVSHRPGPHEGQDDDVVLLPLVLVDRRHGPRGDAGEGRVLSAPLGEDVVEQLPLAVVGCQDGYFLGGISDEDEVLKERHTVLGLAEVLIEEGGRRGLSPSLEVLDVDKLERPRQPRIRPEVPLVRQNPVEIAEVPVPPRVQPGDLRPRPPLPIELDRRDAEPHEPGEHGLVVAGVPAERRVLHHGGKLVVVADEADALEPARRARVVGLAALEDEGDEALDV
mmetsp:Transcript_24880/g.56748  ORF Transcript_24880/g.56748 Transcript_24880/m.56748 type:complete len:356 (-) Transcript_24880:336-1403(-)